MIYILILPPKYMKILHQEWASKNCHAMSSGPEDGLRMFDLDIMTELLGLVYSHLIVAHLSNYQRSYSCIWLLVFCVLMNRWRQHVWKKGKRHDTVGCAPACCTSSTNPSSHHRGMFMLICFFISLVLSQVYVQRKLLSVRYWDGACTYDWLAHSLNPIRI